MVSLLVSNYCRKICSTVDGFKVLLLDDHTSTVFGLSMSQTEAMAHEVFLVDRLANTTRKEMPHAKAIVFVKPSNANIQLLESELENPMFKEYYLYFTNVVKDNYMERLAKADEYECVVQVQEMFCDFKPQRGDMFTLDIESVIDLETPNWNQSLFDDICDGISTLLLSLKKRPAIRVQNHSLIAERIAKDLITRFELSGELFDFRKPGPDPLLLILDRRDDIVSPLITPWSYEAMIHEHIGIKDNRVDMSNAVDVPSDMNEIVLSIESDSFFQDSCRLNFGDLGEKLKDFLNTLQSHRKTKDKISNLQEMQQFVHAMGDMRKISVQASKHVALVSELSRLVERHHTMDVSEAEQEVACHNDRANAFKMIYDLIDRSGINNVDRLRLVTLFALRYESDDATRDLRHLLLALKERGASEEDLKIPIAARRYGGVSIRNQDIFGSDIVTATAKRIQRGIRGVENVYTQHQPWILQILKALYASRLKETVYPYHYGQPSKDRPTDVIIFMIGGSTLEEARVVSEFCEQNPGIRVVLGSNCIHNTKSFMQELMAMSAAIRTTAEIYDNPSAAQQAQGLIKRF